MFSYQGKYELFVPENSELMKELSGTLIIKGNAKERRRWRRRNIVNKQRRESYERILKLNDFTG